jgi:carbon storage regulator
MLVLSRKQGQSIVIANDIVVSVIDIGHGRVQIGVKAPPHLAVHREEVHRRIQQENRMRSPIAFSSGDLPTVEAGCAGTV